MEEDRAIKSMAKKFEELIEIKPIFYVLDNYTYYRKMLDKVSLDKKRLEKKLEIEEEEVAKIIEEGLPRKIDDTRNYIVPLKVNGTKPLNALADTGASVSLHIPVDQEIPFLVGRPFLRTCGAIIDNGKGIMTINNGVVNHVYHVKKRSKVVVEEDPEDVEDWLHMIEVGHDEKGYPKYNTSYF
ncbi:hypothetical protein Tco_1408640, partial [Tanacetum coccineum]